MVKPRHQPVRTALLERKRQAQALAYRALDTISDAAALRLARKALTLDPDCVDAQLIAAQMQPLTPTEYLAAMRAAVAAGERSLGGSFFEEYGGHFWGVIESRPYMRARLKLAMTLWELAREPEAIIHLEAMLDLNPNDNQGVREILVGWYLALDRLSDAQSLLDRYRDDAGLHHLLAQGLERFLAGQRRQAGTLIARARRANPHLREVIATGDLPEQVPDTYAPGSREEVVCALALIADALARHSEAIDWLALTVVGGRS